MALLLEDPYSNPESARTRSTSDATGQAELELQEGGSWFIQISHPACKVEVLAVPASDAPRIEQTVTLRSGIRIFGTVTMAHKRNQARPLVLIDEWAPSPSRTIECDSQGRFDSGPVFARNAEVELTARAAGFAETRRVLELEKQTLVGNGCEVNLTLHSDEVRVLGRVMAPDQEPPGPTDVFLQPLDAGPFLEARKLTSSAVRWRAQATTDEAGRFEVDMLMANQGYQLLAVPRDGFGNALSRIPPLSPGAVHDVGVIEVRPAGTLFGHAKHMDGTPASHLHVTGIPTIPITWEQMKDPEYFPSRHAGRQDTYTSADGRFEFALLPGETTYALYWGDGSIDEDRLAGEFTTRSGEEVGPVLITIPSEEVDLATLHGTVVDAQGLPVESILVEAWNGPATDVVGEGFRAGNLTDPNGAFALERLVAGKGYRLTATDLRGRFTTREWTVAADRVQDPVVLTLEGSPRVSASLEGAVTNKQGIPLSGIEVTLHLSPLVIRCDCMSWRQTTDEHGAFSFGPVVDGVHQVAVVDPQGRHQAAIADVRPGAYDTIVIE